MKKWTVYGICCVSGFLVMSLELLGVRLLAPYFGYSSYVFGSLIGLILLALSVGYVVGGYLGDRSSKPRLFFGLMLAAAGYVLIASIMYPIFLESIASLGSIAGSLLATTVLLGFPMVILAATSPYFIKVLASGFHQGIGFSAGTVYAISTMGSLAGTFLTSFYFIPELGTQFTFRFDSGLMLLVSIVMLAIGNRRFLFGVLLFPLLATPLPNHSNVVYATDSAYNRLEVVEYETLLGLRSDYRSHAIYSYKMKPGFADQGFLLYNLFAIPPLLNGAKSALLLGVAGGVIPAVHERYGETLAIDGVELDPTVLEIGKKYFNLQNVHNLNTTVADARPFLRKESKQYDIIEMDIYNGSGEIPFYLVTKEFFEETRARLTAGGILAVNIFDPSYSIIRDPILNTIAAVYPFVEYADAENGSYFVVAAQSPYDTVSLKKPLNKETRALANKFLTLKQQYVFDPARLVFTDDISPIERISYAAFSKQ